jgi:hypothetical protein
MGDGVKVVADLRRYSHLVQRALPTLLLNGWKVFAGSEPKPGQLVLLQAAPPSEWHLSFYVEDCGDGYHVLESVQTGALMRWGNVGFMVLDEEKIGAGEQARWTDEQFEFHDKFIKVWRKADFYIALPFIHSFDGDLIDIRFRTRHGFDSNITPIEPFPWKKITQKALLAILKGGECAHKNRKEPEA